MSRDLLLAIDQGTTSTRAIAHDLQLRPVAAAQRPLGSRHPRPGWVEQDPEQILASVVESVAEVLDEVGGAGRIAAVGLDNQGETVVAWDSQTACALTPAVSWQCDRSRPIVERLRAAGHEPLVRTTTGLPLDPYFSAGKMAWLVENVPEVARARDAGTLRLGTVDAWLTARLGGEPLSDPSTASRTQLLDLATASWSEPMLTLFDVPRASLPRIVTTAGDLGTLGHATWGDVALPLTALACDQQAALAGHGAITRPTTKATYGTGVFVLATAGERPPHPGEQLLATIAWQLPGATTPSYALDGGVFTAGAALSWLADLGLIADPATSEELAISVPDAGGVRVLPALAGLGAPWWEPSARGVISGLSQATTRNHLARAVLDGIAHRVCDVVEAMARASGRAPQALRVDGGLTANRYLVQRQADLLGIPVDVATASESTALGIAGLAGIGVGLIGPEVIASAAASVNRVEPRMADEPRQAERAAWLAFVRRAIDLAAARGEEGGASPSTA
ncbi:MAG TPA: FGGY family carbohydrate kinase [candidate division Zixibacteria bacterium]|nr:FGGY family carbohydrate kinase [candidate division Zixibacteria bacterium]